MGYRYLDDFQRGISVFAIFSYGYCGIGYPPMSPSNRKTARIWLCSLDQSNGYKNGIFSPTACALIACFDGTWEL